MTTETVLERLKGVKRTGEKTWMACCPAHADKNPSLSISEGAAGKILVKCFAGCASENVAGALGLKMADLMGEDAEKDKPAKKAGSKKRGKIVARYDYKDETGTLIFQVCRMEPKSFCQRVPDPTSTEGWAWGRSRFGVREVIYRLPDVLAAARAGKAIFVVEGEKDVEAAERLGLTATCNPGGAGKWRGGFGDWFAGAKSVIVIADNDAGPECEKPEYWQGQRHANDVVDSMRQRAAPIPVRALTLPPIGGKACKDLSDWVAGGGTIDLLRAAVRDAGEWPYDLYARASAHMGTSGAGKNAPVDQQAGRANNAAGGSLFSLSNESASPSSSAAPAGAKAVENVGGCENGGGKGMGEGSADDPHSFAALRRELIRVMTDKDAGSNQKKRWLCDAVTTWMIERGRFFYDINDRTHEAAMWFDAVEKRLHRVNQDYFESWLAKATAFNRELRDFRFFKAAVQDESLVGDSTSGVEPRRYWARHENSIYISCGEGRVIRVTAESVETVDNGTDDIVFEQGFVMDPWNLLPETEAADPFERCTVFRDMATLDGRGKILTKLWFASMFGVTGWKPLLVFSGTVGSGKTRVATALFELLGMPARVTGIDTLGNIKDFWTSIDKGGLYVLDNADHHIPWLADALSTISTGATFEKKKLYTDTSTITQKSRCWAVVTSSNPTFASDAGLADRLITIQLERVERDTEESALCREIAEARNAGLSWICYMTQKALADKEPAQKGLNRRHPDWADWAFRIGRAAGDESGARTAISENEAFKSIFAISNDGFGKFLLVGIKKRFEGSVGELSELLSTTCEGYSKETWTDAKIGKALKRMDEHLKAIFSLEKLNHSGRAVYKFDARKDETVCPSASQPDLPLTPNNVGSVGGSADKVAENTIYHDFSSTTPNNPNIVGGDSDWDEL
jgi:hypothetical protein